MRGGRRRGKGVEGNVGEETGSREGEGKVLKGRRKGGRREGVEGNVGGRL